MVLQDCQSGSFTPCCLVVGMDGLGFRVWVEGYLGDKDFLAGYIWTTTELYSIITY